MCGLAGAINFRLDIPKLTADLYHRGPDEQTTLEEGNLQLHHHRLAILDIAGGHQPMHLDHLTVMLNGQVYNHNDIRKKYGFSCHTKSDTETILHAYHKLGPACLSEFDGMFIIVVFDRRKNELFIARDRAGKKPVYFYNQGDQFIFASELNAIRNQLSLEIDEDHLKQYIRMGYFYRSSTPYKYISELAAGSYAMVNLGKPVPAVTKWWDIHPYYEKRSEDSFDTALQNVDQYLHTAVKRRVESSDLEVGSFLSGGIDSGIVSAIAKNYNSTLKTFTVSFDGEYDEAPLAKLVADQYKTDHHQIRISYKNLTDDIEKILANYGEPFFDSSAIPSYYVSREARKHLTVILNGDGGDELFGGYRRYVPFAKYDFFKPGFFIRNAAAAAHALMPAPKNKKSRYNYMYRLADLARKKSLGTYLSATIDSFEGFEKNIICAESTLREVQADFDEMNRSSLSGLQKIMNLDFDNILAGDLLVKMDIATMAHSLEGRSPLLSRELLEYVPSLPDDYKIRGKQTKFLLRKLAEKYLPATLIDQPKRGFEIPLKKWVGNELKDIIFAYLQPKDAYARQFVKPEFLDALLSHKVKSGDEKRAKMLWTVFALEVWYKKCFLAHD
ncbi:MAG TPA: asparagine synthase (glutamine-hydrolyzing) [Chitinophagaceae bacterium]|nr:asparagine synthase (glutamine-hydrolyzing) [Chitinophagaceae bacterium]